MDIANKSRTASWFFFFTGGLALLSLLILFPLFRMYSLLQLIFVLLFIGPALGSGLLGCGAGLGLRYLHPAARKLALVHTIVFLVWLTVISLPVLGFALLAFVQGMEGSYGPYNAADRIRAAIVIIIHFALMLGLWYGLAGRFIPFFRRPDVQAFFADADTRETIARNYDETAPARRKLALKISGLIAASIVGLIVLSRMIVLANNILSGEQICNAAANGNITRVQHLLHWGARLSSRDRFGQTPLHLAAQEGHADMIEFLLRQGADIDAVNNEGMTPLHWGCNNGHVEATRVLLAHGAKVNIKDQNGMTPLYRAAMGGFGYGDIMAVIRLLVEHGADVDAANNDGYTPLHWQGVTGNRQIAAFLLAHGADPNARDQKGNTPLVVAEANDRSAIASLLIQHGGHH